MKKPSKNKSNNPERARKKGEKKAKRRKVVRAKKILRKEAIRIDKIRKERKFQEYMDNLVGKL